MEITYSRAGAGGQYGMACGPTGFDTASAEICICEKGKNTWMSTNWMAEVPDSIQVNIADHSLFRFFSGVPVYDSDGEENYTDMEKFDGGDDYSFETLSEYTGPYAELLPDLLQMLYLAMKTVGYASEDRFEYKEDIWRWLKDIGVDYDLPWEDEENAEEDDE